MPAGIRLYLVQTVLALRTTFERPYQGFKECSRASIMAEGLFAGAAGCLLHPAQPVAGHLVEGSRCGQGSLVLVFRVDFTPAAGGGVTSLPPPDPVVHDPAESQPVHAEGGGGRLARPPPVLNGRR